MAILILVENRNSEANMKLTILLTCPTDEMCLYSENAKHYNLDLKGLGEGLVSKCVPAVHKHADMNQESEHSCFKKSQRYVHIIPHRRCK